MTPTLATIPISSLLLAFLPVALVVLVLHRWRLDARYAIYASLRMLVQLLAVGYVLSYVFEAEHPAVIVAVIALMIGVSAWIALRPLAAERSRRLGLALAAIGGSGLCVLAIVTQWVLTLPRWFEPSVVVPLAGMIFANTMNSVSLAAERDASERRRGVAPEAARRAALDAALIPQINGLLAVGLVSLPGMMTGQILSGVEPLIAVRYQIMVMCMVFGAGGLGAILYLVGVGSEPAG